MDLVAFIFSILAFCGTASTHTALILWVIFAVLYTIVLYLKDGKGSVLVLLIFLSAGFSLLGCFDESLALILATAFYGAYFIYRMGEVRV